MTRSMTAFARELKDTEKATISWEIKSLNHRYLEVFLRLPDELKQLEVKLRECVQQLVGRGKLDIACALKKKNSVTGSIRLDFDRISDLIRACNDIEAQMGVGKAISALDVLNYPGVVDEPLQPSDLDEAWLLASLKSTLESLNANKAQEGKRLENLVLDRAKQLRNIVQTIRKRQPEVQDEIKQKLEKKLAEITENTDNDRLQQELVYLAQKMDINEELDRLVSHLASLQNAFTLDESIGRRLDFLMQEFNREANTIASKSADTETTKAAVELKVLIEQMREQVQNIE